MSITSCGEDSVTVQKQPLIPNWPSQLCRLGCTAFTEQHVQQLSNERQQVTLRLHGIHCAACVWLLERLPQLQAGVIDGRVNLAKSTIELVWNPQQVKLSQIAHQIARLGYRAMPLISSRKALEQKRLVRQQLVQIAIAVPARET